MQAKEKVLDRIEQSIVLFKNHFVNIYAPVFILQVGIYMLFYLVTSLMLRGINPNHINLETLYQNFIIFIPMLLIYIVLQMILIVGTYKTISDAYHNREYTLGNNYTYACNHFFEIFKTYYYMFLYVYLIPCLGFIVGGLYVIYLVDSGGLILTHTGFEGENLTGGFRWEALAGVAFLYFFIAFFYVVYRGVKANFALPSAIDSDEYTKEIFQSSVAFTKNNWWRILGNLILVGVTGGLVTAIFSGILSGILMAVYPPIPSQSSNFGNENPTVIANEMTHMFDTSIASPQTIILTGISRVLGTLLFAFTLVFVFFLYQRLKAEYLGETEESSEDQSKNENEAPKQPSQEIL